MSGEATGGRIRFIVLKCLGVQDDKNFDSINQTTLHGRSLTRRFTLTALSEIGQQQVAPLLHGCQASLIKIFNLLLTTNK